MYLSNGLGGGSESLYLALRRQAVPGRVNHDLAAFALPILGEWTAVVFEELAQATGDMAWSTKANALATAVRRNCSANTRR